MIENLLVLLFPRKSHKVIKRIVKAMADPAPKDDWVEGYIESPVRVNIQRRLMGVVGIDFRRYADQVDLYLLGLGCRCGRGQKNRTLYCAPRDNPQ